MIHVLSPTSARLLQLQLDIHEIVRRPGTGVLEGERALVAPAHLLHFLVELPFATTLDEERSVHDHAVADDFVAAARNRDWSQGLVHVGYVPITGLFHRRLHETTKLHPREVGRGCNVAGD